MVVWLNIKNVKCRYICRGVNAVVGLGCLVPLPVLWFALVLFPSLWRAFCPFVRHWFSPAPIYCNKSCVTVFLGYLYIFHLGLLHFISTFVTWFWFIGHVDHVCSFSYFVYIQMIPLWLGPLLLLFLVLFLWQGLTPYEKKKYVWKMLYIYMLGYDVDFGHMEAVSLISAPKYPEKQVLCTP